MRTRRVTAATVHASSTGWVSSGIGTKWSTTQTESKPASSAAWATSRAWLQAEPNCGRQRPKRTLVSPMPPANCAARGGEATPCDRGRGRLRRLFGPGRAVVEQAQLRPGTALLPIEDVRRDAEPLWRRAGDTLALAAPRFGVAPSKGGVRVWLVHRPAHRPRLQPSLGGQADPLAGDLNIGGQALRPGRPSPVHHRRARRRADAHEGIDDEVAGLRHGQDEPFDELYRELARMDRLLDVVRLDVRKDPDVARVLPERVAGVLAGARSLPGALAGILLRNADGVEVERVVAPLGEPEDHLVAARKPALAVEAVLEVPDDAVAELELRVAAEDGVEQEVERDDLVCRDVVAHLPAEAAPRSEDADALADDLLLAPNIRFQVEAFALVGFRQVVRRRGDDEAGALVGQAGEQVPRVARVEHDLRPFAPPLVDDHAPHRTARIIASPAARSNARALDPGGRLR